MSCDVKGCKNEVAGANTLGWHLCAEHLYTPGLGADMLLAAARRRLGLEEEPAEKQVRAPENKALKSPENK